jgi:hypothetical protein
MTTVSPDQYPQSTLEVLKKQAIANRKGADIPPTAMAIIMGVEADYLVRWEENRHEQEIPFFLNHYITTVNLIITTYQNGRLGRFAEVMAKIAAGRGWLASTPKKAWIQAIVDELQLLGYFTDITHTDRNPDEASLN